MTKQVVYIAMENTLASGLNVLEDWTIRLSRQEKGLYLECKPLVSEEEVLKHFPLEIYDVRICSGFKGITDEHTKNIKEEKIEWLNTYFPHIKKVTFVKDPYNKNVRNCSQYILIDNCDWARYSYKGKAFIAPWL